MHESSDWSRDLSDAPKNDIHKRDIHPQTENGYRWRIHVIAGEAQLFSVRATQEGQISPE